MLTAIDSTLPQFSADALLIVLVIVNSVIGWRTGTLRRLLSLIGLYAAFIAAYYTGNSFASLFRKGDIFANGWSFVAVLVVVVVVVEVLGRLFDERLKRLAVVTFDRFAGMFIGAAIGFLQAGVLFMVALAVGGATPGPGNSVPPSRDSAANAVRSGTLSGQAIRVEPALRSVFAPLTSTDLTTHFEDGTQLTTVPF
jgi:hypothetical protein